MRAQPLYEPYLVFAVAVPLKCSKICVMGIFMFSVAHKHAQAGQGKSLKTDTLTHHARMTATPFRLAPLRCLDLLQKTELLGAAGGHKLQLEPPPNCSLCPGSVLHAD